MRLLVFFAAAVLASCHHRKKEEAPPVRPVLSLVVAKVAAKDPVLVCHIEPRTKTELAFRVGGRVAHRAVSVGDHVKRGDEIATLDRRSLELALDVVSANVASASARRNDADLTHQRQSLLLSRGSAALSAVDATKASRTSAAASSDEAAARWRKAREDLSYGVLKAEFDGVITRADFEVEQVVAANQAIGELARPDLLDVLCDAAEAVASGVQLGDTFNVRSAEPPEIKISGKVRQIDPAAEKVTRTRQIWIGIDGVPEALRLGTTMYAEQSASAPPALRVPLTAVVDANGPAPAVWVVEGDRVQRRPVRLAAGNDGDAVIEDGLREGERVVTAGVHSLKPGQRVKLPRDRAQ